MYRVKFHDLRGKVWWLSRGRLIHLRDNATCYAHPSAARDALARFVNRFNVAGWSIEIAEIKRRYRERKGAAAAVRERPVR